MDQTFQTNTQLINYFGDIYGSGLYLWYICPEMNEDFYKDDLIGDTEEFYQKHRHNIKDVLMLHCDNVSEIEEKYNIKLEQCKKPKKIIEYNAEKYEKHLKKKTEKLEKIYIEGFREEGFSMYLIEGVIRKCKYFSYPISYTKEFYEKHGDAFMDSIYIEDSVKEFFEDKWKVKLIKTC